jgi:hypothetical protein
VANRTIRTPQRARKFVKTLRMTGGNVSRACAAINIGRSTAYEWRDQDAEFAAAWDEAVEAGLDDLEEEARRRALEGLMQKKFTKNGAAIIDPATNQPYFERVYSDSLMQMLLKAGRPEKYRDRQEITGSLNIDVSKLSDPELEALASGSAPAKAPGSSRD